MRQSKYGTRSGSDVSRPARDDMFIASKFTDQRPLAGVRLELNTAVSLLRADNRIGLGGYKHFTSNEVKKPRRVSHPMTHPVRHQR